MAGYKDFYKGIRGVRTCAVDDPKPNKGDENTFNKYRIYNTTRWKTLREYVLKKNPICNVCKSELATEVDHITPFSVGMTDRQKLQLGFDIDNLQSICRLCHEKKHNHYKEKNKTDEIQ
jgi:5-methylcytosine-specific restriction endonuclease McrA